MRTLHWIGLIVAHVTYAELSPKVGDGLIFQAAVAA
jgi:hypothetical protein